MFKRVKFVQGEIIYLLKRAKDDNENLYGSITTFCSSCTRTHAHVNGRTEIIEDAGKNDKNV